MANMPVKAVRFFWLAHFPPEPTLLFHTFLPRSHIINTRRPGSRIPFEQVSPWIWISLSWFTHIFLDTTFPSHVLPGSHILYLHISLWIVPSNACPILTRARFSSLTQGGKVSASDISPTMVEEAKRRYETAVAA